MIRSKVYLKAAKLIHDGSYTKYSCFAVGYAATGKIHLDSIEEKMYRKLYSDRRSEEMMYPSQFDNTTREGVNPKELRILALLFMREITK